MVTMKPTFSSIVIFVLTLLVVGWAAARSDQTAARVFVESPILRIEFDKQMRSRVIARFEGKEIALGPFTASETVSIDGAEVADFTLTGHKSQNVRETLGAGKQTTLTGTAGTLQKTVTVTMYDRFPQMAFFTVR